MVGTLGLFMPAAWATPDATQLPTGGLSPTAAITATGANMTVDGHAANNVIAWDSFSIGANAAVNFTGSHNYLNYVTGRSLSEIYGTMSGGGNVYLFNPNGIIFGENAKINVGSLYASTQKLDMEDLQAFAQGKEMPLAGEVVGDVVNRMNTSLGNMTITMEGDVVSFANYDAATKKLGQGSAQYDVHANKVHIGYEGDTTPTAAPTNLSADGVESVYLQLVGHGQLAGLDDHGKYMLSEDISGEQLDSSGYFYGVLDGAGHTAKLDGSSLFSSNLNGATVRNLTLTGSVTSDGGEEDLGALTSQAENSTIANVFNRAVINSTVNSAYNMPGIGGLVGYMNGGTLKNSANMANIEVTDSGSLGAYAGGLAGIISGVTVYGAYNTGNITGTGNAARVWSGGLFGQVTGNINIKNSYNLGKVESTVAGGLVGQIHDDSPKTFENVFNSGIVTAVANAGGFAGEVVDSKLTAKNAYNNGSVSSTSANADGITYESGGSTFNLTNVYNTGKVNGSDAFAYYDAGGNKTFVSSAAEIASSEAFADTSVWRTYGNNAPLLKTFLSPLYLPASSVTYENGQAVYRLYVYGKPSHLQGYRNYGSQWGIYEGLVSSDQLGFDLFFEPVPATTSEETDYMSGYRAINGATQVDNNDTEEENLLDDAAAKAALDISSSVQHTTVTEDDIRAMMGSGGTTISSKTGDDVTTEHFEVGDFDDQSAGKVEH